MSNFYGRTTPAVRWGCGGCLSLIVLLLLAAFVCVSVVTVQGLNLDTKWQAPQLALDLGEQQDGTTPTPPATEAPAESAAKIEVLQEEAVSQQAATPTPVDQVSEQRYQRLLDLDPVFRGQGLPAWASAAGFTFDSLASDARQPEETTFSQEGDDVVVVSGYQVRVVNLVAPWPTCFTTDQVVPTTANTRWHRPDQFDPISNPSVLYTDNAPFTGTATIWGDCRDWPELSPENWQAQGLMGQAQAQPQNLTGTCMTASELQALGGVVNFLYHPANTLAGAQIRFTQGWSAPAGWVIQKDGMNVTSVNVGDTASVWSPESCRPLGW